MDSNIKENSFQKAQPRTEEEIEAIKRYLMSLVEKWVDYHNTRNFSAMLAADYFTPTFDNISPPQPIKGQTMANYVHYIKEYTDTCPEFRVNLMDISCEFRGSKALVMTDGEQEVDDGVRMTWFTTVTFPEEDGKWKCCKIATMRGSAGGMEGGF